MILIIIGCKNSTNPDYNNKFESLTNLDAKAAIALANDWKFTTPKITAHVTPSEVIIDFPDGRTVKKALPDSLMFIAIAPYINGTHTCETHYPSSCDGELKETILKINVKDENGLVLFDGNITTLRNGFFELWLPRNKLITLQINDNTLTGSETFPTKADSRTCITTIKLK